jgi:hypothetical protein
VLPSSHLVPTLKRWIVLAHLYLGVAFSVLFVMWFATGVVLMYSPYPALTADEKQHALPPLECGHCIVSALGALQVAGIDTGSSSVFTPIHRRSCAHWTRPAEPVWRCSLRSATLALSHSMSAHAMPAR